MFTVTHSHNYQARARNQRAKKVKGNCLERCEAVAVSVALPVAPQRYTGDPAHQKRSDARRCGRRFLDFRPSITTTSPPSIHAAYNHLQQCLPSVSSSPTPLPVPRTASWALSTTRPPPRRTRPLSAASWSSVYVRNTYKEDGFETDISLQAGVAFLHSSLGEFLLPP